MSTTAAKRIYHPSIYFCRGNCKNGIGKNRRRRRQLPGSIPGRRPSQPAKDAVHFSFYAATSGTTTLTIYDALGNKVWQQVDPYKVGYNQIRIDRFNQVPNGTLYYTLNSRDFNSKGRFVKIN